MSSTRTFSPRDLRCLAVLVGAAVTLGCSGSKDPDPIPSQTVATVTPQLEPPPPLPPPPIRELPPSSRSTVKVIDDGGNESNPQSLVEASRLAKAQKGRTPEREPIATITDENLHEYAAGAEVIVLESEPAVPNPASTPVSANKAPQADDTTLAGGTLSELEDPLPLTRTEDPDTVRDEDYWRSRALELRMAWRRTVDRIEELELESAALRQQFYAEDDPYIRDSQLKPAWDRVLDRLEELQDRAVQYEQELDVFIEEGRQAGALQGWLNQGWELEPTSEERARTAADKGKEPIPHQSIDVTIAEDEEEEEEKGKGKGKP